MVLVQYMVQTWSDPTKYGWAKSSVTFTYELTKLVLNLSFKSLNNKVQVTWCNSTASIFDPLYSENIHIFIHIQSFSIINVIECK